MPRMTSADRPVRATNAARKQASRGLSAAGVAGIAWAVLALLLWLAVGWPLYVAWLIAGTPVTFAIFAFDKARAKSGGWRVPERALLGFILLGGVAGGWLGMKWLRHKTLHRQFWVVLWLATALHLAILGWVWLG
jgi:uncharacterized membrane protein YsdA (DUF1294 family)